MRAAEIMTLDPMFLTSEGSVAAALDLCREYDIRHIPIVENGSLVGMVSSHDLSGIVNYRPAEKPVRDIMNTAVLTVDPETPVSEVIDLMVENKIGAVPVTEGSDEKLIGIISYVDVLNSVRSFVDEVGE